MTVASIVGGSSELNDIFEDAHWAINHMSFEQFVVCLLSSGQMHSLTQNLLELNVDTDKLIFDFMHAVCTEAHTSLVSEGNSKTLKLAPTPRFFNLSDLISVGETERKKIHGKELSTLHLALALLADDTNPFSIALGHQTQNYETLLEQHRLLVTT